MSRRAQECLSAPVLLVVGFTAVLLPPLESGAVEDGELPWQVIHREAGIMVSRRKVEGSRLMEFLGVATIDAPLARVVAVLDDVNSRRQFSQRGKDSREVERNGLGRLVTYDRTGAPWPVADRDMVIATDFQLDEQHGQVVVSFHETTHPSAPLVRGVVRVPLIRGHFLLRPTAGGRTEVQYQVRFDPGGRLPVWLANWTSKQTPLETLQALRKLAPLRRPSAVETEVANRADYRALMALAAGIPEAAATP